MAEWNLAPGDAILLAIDNVIDVRPNGIVLGVTVINGPDAGKKTTWYITTDQLVKLIRVMGKAVWIRIERRDDKYYIAALPLPESDQQ